MLLAGYWRLVKVKRKKAENPAIIRADSLPVETIRKSTDYIIKSLKRKEYILDVSVVGSYGRKRYKDIDILIRVNTHSRNTDFKRLNNAIIEAIIEVSYPFIFDFWLETTNKKKFHAFVTRKGLEWVDITSEIQNPTLTMPIKSRKQLGHLFKAQSQLGKVRNPKTKTEKTGKTLNGISMLSALAFIGIIVWAYRRQNESG